MMKKVAHMIVIDRCPTCQGVWLDAGELDHLTRDVAREAMMAIARGVMSAS
jgi:Zn-finger nucleic acid-binding protein